MTYDIALEAVIQDSALETDKGLDPLCIDYEQAVDDPTRKKSRFRGKDDPQRSLTPHLKAREKYLRNALYEKDRALRATMELLEQERASMDGRVALMEERFLSLRREIEDEMKREIENEREAFRHERSVLLRRITEMENEIIQQEAEIEGMREHFEKHLNVRDDRIQTLLADKDDHIRKSHDDMRTMHSRTSARMTEMQMLMDARQECLEESKRKELSDVRGIFHKERSSLQERLKTMESDIASREMEIKEMNRNFSNRLDSREKELQIELFERKMGLEHAMDELDTQRRLEAALMRFLVQSEMEHKVEVTQEGPAKEKRKGEQRSSSKTRVQDPNHSTQAIQKRSKQILDVALG